MDNYFVIEQTDASCINLNQVAQQMCLPKRQYCNFKPDGLLSICGEEYCACCGSSEKYFIHLVKGRKMMFQTLLRDFTNEDCTCPTQFFADAEVLDDCGNILASGLDIFSRYTQGWDGEKSYQTWEICPDEGILEGINCFKIRFYDPNSINDEGEYTNECCTQFMKLHDNECDGKEFIEVSSENNKDCYGSYYGISVCHGGNSNIQYSNKLTIPATIKYNGFDNTSDTFNETISIKSKLKEYWQINFCEKLPPYMVAYLGNSIFTGKNTIIINGEEYLYDSVSIRQNLKGCDFFPQPILVYRECETNVRCN